MKVGLQVNSFTWPGGPEAIAPTLARVARDADQAGFDSIWLMDHFFQIRSIGRPEEPMLEGWTTLGFLAAHTERARLGLMVGGVHYRQPALWVKAATALDVLSGGRAWLGIGAAWNEQESRGLGFPFPPLAERFELLEETLQIAHAMWEGERGTEAPFEGRHTQAVHLLNSPQSISRPRVADHDRRRRRAEDAPPGRAVRRRDQRLRRTRDDPPQVRGHPRALRGDRPRPRRDRALDAPGRAARARAGRPRATRPQQVVDRFGELSDAGAQHVIFSVADVWDPRAIEILGRDVIPAVHALGD